MAEPPPRLFRASERKDLIIRAVFYAHAERNEISSIIKARLETPNYVTLAGLGMLNGDGPVQNFYYAGVGLSEVEVAVVSDVQRRMM